MKAIVLCAGRGKRMRELTAHNSKPLIKLWGRSMIDWQLDRLKKGGIREVVVNSRPLCLTSILRILQLIRRRNQSNDFSGRNFDFGRFGN